MKLLAATLIGMTSLVLAGQPAAAEWFADIYAGASFTQNHDPSNSMIAS